MKKILCLLLAAILLLPQLTALPAVAAEADTAAIEMVQKLGILPQDLDAKDTVTRTEAVRFILNLRGVTSYTGDGIRKFGDVSIYHDDYAMIDTAVAMEIIKGDGEGLFRPIDDATVQEAMIMLLRAMGYHRMIDAKGGSMADYYAAALDQNLLRGVMIPLSDPIDGASLAQLMRNSFSVGIMEQVSVVGGNTGSYQVSEDKTILSYLGLAMGEGVVTDNGISSIHYTAGPMPQGRVKIDGVDFIVGDTDAAELLGYHVEYYYYDRRDGEISELRYVVGTKNETLTLPLTTEFTYTGEKLSYQTEDGKQAAVNIRPSDVMLLNGQAVEFDAGLLTESSGTGSVTFISNSQSGTGYQVASIEAYRNDVVASVDEEKIYLRYGAAGSNPILEIPKQEEGGVFTVWKDGAVSSLEEVKGGQAVSYAVSPNGNRLLLQLSEQQVDGKVENMASDPRREITVNGVVYPVASDARNTEKINLTQSLRFTLNFEGAVIDVSAEQDRDYAFVLGVSIDDGLEETASVKLYNSDGNALVLRLSDKVRLNSQKVEGGPLEAAALIRDNAANDLIVYHTNAAGQIDNVDFCQPASGNLRQDQERFVKLPNTSEAYEQYNGRSLNGVGIYHTKVFSIPMEENLDERDCSVTNDLVRGNNYRDVVFYDMGMNGAAKAILIREKDTSGFKVDPATICIATKLVKAVDGNGDIRDKLYYIAGGSESSVFLADEVTDVATEGKAMPLSALSYGDIFVYDTNPRGELNKYAVYYIHEQDSEKEGFLHYGGGGVGTNQAVQVAYGRLIYSDSELVTIGVNDGMELFSHTGSIPTFQINCERQLCREISFDSLRTENFDAGQPGQKIVVIGDRHNLKEVYVYEAAE